jgi:methanogenic corrinoid protein MtbC1
MNENLVKSVNEEFLDLLLKGNHSSCSELVRKYLNDKITINELYEDVFKKALYDIGELWEYNKISVATEHLSSAIVEGLLNELYVNVVCDNKINKTVVVACVENEFHQIGIKMISDLFEMKGWNSYFLGANTPTKELIDFMKTVKPDLLALSLSIYFHFPVLENMIDAIRKDFPDMQILVGGQAFRHGGRSILEKYRNIIYKHDLPSTELFIKNYN